MSEVCRGPRHRRFGERIDDRLSWHARVSPTERRRRCSSCSWGQLHLNTALPGAVDRIVRMETPQLDRNGGQIIDDGEAILPAAETGGEIGRERPVGAAQKQIVGPSFPSVAVYRHRDLHVVEKTSQPRRMVRRHKVRGDVPYQARWLDYEVQRSGSPSGCLRRDRLSSPFEAAVERHKTKR